MLSNIGKPARQTTFYADTEHWSLLSRVNGKPKATDTTLSDDQRLAFASHPANELPAEQVEEIAAPKKGKSDQHIKLRKGSPWESYCKRYEVELAGWNAVCQTQPATSRLFGVRLLRGPDVKEQVEMLCRLHHENILETYEIFVGADFYYTVSENVEISLDEIVAAPLLPNDIELAAIVCQILAGISYLNSLDLVHGSLDCASVVLSRNGDVKLANLHRCMSRYLGGRNTSTDISALGRIMITLMEKDPPESTIVLEKPDQWSPDAVNFVSLTFAASLIDLREGAQQKSELVWGQRPTPNKDSTIH
uniref:Serine/threonine-protein kinase dst2 n=1 Tax=Talaromyces marneffei PM1 TaxID=1077442 RepID=A0A093URM6_TALMA